MGKIINSTYISLDGVVEQPHTWPTLEGRPSDERAERIQTDLLLACDAVLMGRRTYDSFAAVWPSRSGDPASDRINTMPKYVVSTTLKDPDWANTSVISSDVVDELRKLRERPGQDVVQYGFGAVSRLLMENGLLDELRLWIHPLFVGRGTNDDVLFPKGPPTQFELVDSKILASGMAILSYRVA
ncbi:MAG TPA: dihydrofolate reductase family protein [Thermoleophilaceae bacterium]|jgi:dihydrofolate reductase